MKNKIRKMRIKQVLIASLLVSLCAISIPSVYALFSGTSEVAENNFKGGIVNVSVIEKQEHEDSSNNKEAYSYISKTNESASKEVSVKNKAVAAYVRISLEATIVSDSDASVVYLDGADVSYTFKKGTAWKYDATNKVYYYTEILETNEQSELLLETVTLNQDIPEGYHLEVKVLSDAISAYPQSNLAKAWGIDFASLSAL